MKDFEQCVAITQLALDNDCTIDSADDRVLNAGPLFSIIGTNMLDAHASASVHAIDYLCSIGWDLEEKNRLGQTPLLYAATECSPQVARCLRSLIQRGARLDARDEAGRDPLLCALSAPNGPSSWVHMTYSWDAEEDDPDSNWWLDRSFGTKDRKYVRDYYNTESILDSLTTLPSPDISRPMFSLDRFESSPLVRDHESHVTVEQRTPIGLSMSDPDNGASPCAEEFIPNSRDDDYVCCFDDHGDAHWIRNPIHVLKDRVKTKLKILLEAGCDPNDFDYDGNSTNDYARRGLWPQWLWALEKTGYVFDEEHDRWIKRTDSA